MTKKIHGKVTHTIPQRESQTKGGITIRDENIWKYIKCKKEVDLNGETGLEQCKLKVDNLELKFKTNLHTNDSDIPQSWTSNGYMGITEKSIGTPYFAFQKKFGKIAMKLKEKGLNVVIDPIPNNLSEKTKKEIKKIIIH